ncbi:glycosyltransferase [Alkalibacillus salilacus]|uniref:Spore coat polysaccharide biosynthesis predicted glycosyltransferase SpsG n=1 Tax=Alkalibacillus salilacus TaxID=284582 RepID=A0ABT9VF40_9BACI|nr:glycosyltransferase [Alkalibacillus salilacus]MDQ0159582.1 spore coat polysaccharide biosynthesis predicted glycosyltransferase SpsG [Alkalibacillus salilacus]
MKSIIILTEGGSNIGLGHIARCKALYDEAVAQGYEVEFIVNTSDESIKLLEQVDVQYVDWCNFSFIQNKIKDYHNLIVDSYLVSKTVCEQLVQQAGHCLILDDLNRIDYPGNAMVVNLSLEASESRSHYYSGRDYIILRKPLTETRHKTINQDVERVFITLGSAGNQSTQALMKSLAGKYPYIHFYVLLAGDESVESLNQTHIHRLDQIGPDDMLEQIMQADIVITAAGQTLLEVIRTQTPFIPIATADNQQNNVASLINGGLNEKVIRIDSPMFYQDVLKQFERLLSYQERQKLSDELSGLIDGNGSKRVIQLLINGGQD